MSLSPELAGIGSSIAGFAFVGIGGGIEAIGQYQQTAAMVEAARQTGKLEKAEADQNARQMRKNQARIMAAQRVAFGRSGVRLEGTPLDVLAENAGEYELDAVTRERYGLNAKRLAYAQMRNYKEQGIIMAAASGFNAPNQGINQGMSVLGSILPMLGA